MPPDFDATFTECAIPREGGSEGASSATTRANVTGATTATGATLVNTATAGTTVAVTNLDG